MAQFGMIICSVVLILAVFGSNAVPRRHHRHHKKPAATHNGAYAANGVYANQETKSNYQYEENDPTAPSVNTASNYGYSSQYKPIEAFHYPNENYAGSETESATTLGVPKLETPRRDLNLQQKWKNHSIPYIKKFKQEIDQGKIRHHDYEELTWFMKYFAEEYPEIAKLYDLGTTVQNRKLWAMEITDNPGRHEPGEPEMKYIGNIHGNEVVGREILLQLIKHLCENYEKDDKVTELVDKTRIHILPSMNPDGYELASAHKKSENPDITEDLIGRLNANGVDLNRNFPDQFFESVAENYEPETQAVMDWIGKHPFALSASFHSGAMVVTYPFDDSPSGQTSYSATPDDDLFRQIAKTYSENHPKMHLANPKMNCSRPMKRFTDGVSNGAVWSPMVGGMQDYNYVKSNCYEVTVELGCHKFPTEKELSEYWHDNQKPLLKFIDYANKGVRGFVKDESGNAIKGAHISIGDRRHDIRTSDDGDFWRLLVPGTYEVQARAKGFQPTAQNVEVTPGESTKINFTMSAKQVDPLEAALGHVNRATLISHDLMYRYDGRDSGNAAPKELVQKIEAQTTGREGTTESQDNMASTDTEVGSGSGMDESAQAQKLAESLAINNPPIAKVTKIQSIVKREKMNNATQGIAKRETIIHPEQKKRSKLSMKTKPKTEKTILKSQENSSASDSSTNTTDPNPASLNVTGIDTDIAKEVEEKFHVKPVIGMHLKCKIPGKDAEMSGQLKYLGHISNLPKRNKVIVAGLALDHTEDLGTDGSFLGKRYCIAPVKKGYFVPAKNCSPI